MTKNDFYRYCRLLHGWLSAFAFIALCFFSLTGLLLNHPDWFSGKPSSIVKQKSTLSPTEIGQLRASDNPSAMLVDLAAKRIALIGTTGEGDADGNVVGDELYVRMRGVRGTSFLHADLRNGALDVTIESTSTFTMLNELHRAERAGKTWQLAVDVIAVALILMSLIGYLIFLSMRGTRLRTAVLLTAVSTIGLYLIFLYAVT